MNSLMNKTALIITIIIIAYSSSVYAQDTKEQELLDYIEKAYTTDEPSWLLLERGRQAFELGEYGLASRVFREVIERDKISPDAELWLARIFEKEGEYVLAEKQYNKALENSNDFYIPEQKFSALYSLAEIYRKTDQYGKYEKTLNEIIECDEDRVELFKLQYAMMELLKKADIDKLLELYRYDKDKSNRAFTELGIFYYKTGRYNEAEVNLVLPVVVTATVGFNYIYDKTANYEFTDFNDLIETMQSYPELTGYIEYNNLFMNLYYLSASLYADGYYEEADDLWNIIVKYDHKKSTWRNRARRQLRAPFIEPVIDSRF